MLDPWIIEEIRRREQEERERREQRPVLEIRIETPEHSPLPERVREDEPSRDRGVAIIDFVV